jgi:hypothetical protein
MASTSQLNRLVIKRLRHRDGSFVLQYVETPLDERIRFSAGNPQYRHRDNGTPLMQEL